MGSVDVWSWAQVVAAPALGLFLLRVYGRFLGSLYRFATTYLGLSLLIVLVYLIVYAQVGTGFGIPYLFWHEDFKRRAIASWGVTMLLGVIGVIAYYLDPHPWETDRKTADWLAPEEAIKARWRLGRPTRREGLADARARAPKAGTETEAPRLHWWSYLIFVANAVIDPLGLLPGPGLLEPTMANQVRLQRFLRTCR